jgi:hypothetical protein
MQDYDGSLWKHWQKKLDDAGIDYDITNLTGATVTEINDYVEILQIQKKNQENGGDDE